MKATYIVTRNCCPYGNCMTCTRVSPYGVPLRVVQAGPLSKRRATVVAANWQAYDSRVERTAKETLRATEG
jgi:hypothetical protein